MTESNKLSELEIELMAATKELSDFCEENLDLVADFMTSQYPFRVKFYPALLQPSLFGPGEENEDVDENGEVRYLMVTVGLNVTVQSTLRFDMDQRELKKLIRMAARTGNLYYHAFREKAGDTTKLEELKQELMAGDTTKLEELKREMLNKGEEG